MQKNIRLLSAVSFVEGLAILIWLASIPTEGRFFSPTRIGLLGALLVITVGWLIVYFQPGRALRLVQWLLKWRGRYALGSLCICFPLLLLAAAAQSEIWSPYIEQTMFERLLPMLFLVALTFIQLGLFLLLSEVDATLFKDSFPSLLKGTTIIFFSLLLIWGFISLTHIGITKDVVGLSWGPPGVPVTLGQMVLVFAIGNCIMIPIWVVFRRGNLPPLLDVTIFVGLWVLAVILWTRQPMLPSYFAPAPMPPNYEYYPYSDAAIFDRSSYQLLFGAGFETQLVRRPLYVGLLALFHAMAGPGYDETVFLQILVLALIPAVVYLVASKLSNRLAGLLAGGLIIIRETNAIYLSGQIATAHAKLMMSDLLTLLGVAVILFLVITTTSKNAPKTWELAVLGASVGLTMLVRAQTIIILFPILLVFIFRERAFKAGLRQSLIILFAVGLVLAPWLWRNWNLTGTFLLDDRTEQRLLARNYSTDPATFPVQSQNETEQEFAARLQKQMVIYASAHPLDVLFFVSNHFFHNLIDSAVYFAPIYSADPPEEMLSQVPYWGEWDGHLSVATAVPLLVTAIFFAFGLSMAQKHNGLVGWLPLLVFFFYSGGNALVRTSGWRFVLPVDWIILMYICIGLAYLPSMIGRVLQERAGPSEASTPGSTRMGLVFAALLLAGASVPLAERLIPGGSFESPAGEARRVIEQNGILTSAEFEAFLRQEDAVLVSGIALYPRYFAKHAPFEIAELPTNYTYLNFLLIGDGSWQIVLPLQGPLTEFPHTGVVTVIGCKTADYISAWAVVMQLTSTQVLLRTPEAPLVCPLKEPN